MNRQTATQTHQQKPTVTPTASGLLQRKGACGNHTMAGGECEECGKKKQILQRAPLSPRGRGIESEGEVPPVVHEVLRSPGQPLEPDTRALMELRFGHDFSRVRVHTDARAAESARSVNALAYTVGQDIAFGEGQYAPRTKEGWKLIAHELVHTIQQSSRMHFPSSDLEITAAGDTSEREAENTSREIARKAFNVTAAGPIRIARQSPGEGENPERCRIDVRATKVGGVPGLIGFKHLFIVFTDSRGRETGYRAGPGGECPQTIGVGFGTISEDHGRYDSSFPDWDPAAPSVTVLSGGPACGKDSCITDEMIRLHKACIPYWIFGPNSNSVVSSVLSVCGIPRMKPDIVAPGWDDPIINLPRMAVPAPAPGGYSRPVPPPLG